ncbi:MAG: NfeD family protein [Actinomycetota bacterium]|nr:NfeD family protein [Actinomycetota bacterium]
MDDPDGWRWIWLGAAAFLAVGELVTPGAFFMLSFAIGAAVACALAFLGVDVAWEIAAFIVTSVAALLILVPLGRRMSGGEQGTVGATRWAGQRGIVLGAIPGSPHETGLVRVEREEWRAESADGSEIVSGTKVIVLRVDGTRLIVKPQEE